jgi:hypothetical protein
MWLNGAKWLAALVEAAVARLWARTAGMGQPATRRLLADFRDRALLQAGNSLHDLQVDYLRAAVPPAEQRRLHSAFCEAYGDPATWATMPPHDDGGYGWRLARHLHEAGRTDDLAMLLTNATYLVRKLARLGIGAVVSDLALCPERADIQHISEAIRAGAVALAEAPEELANQIVRRVGAVGTLHDLPPRKPPFFRLRLPSLLPADPALLRTFTGHTNLVQSCAFGPNGKLALSASYDNTLRLWDVANGQQLTHWLTDFGLGCCAYGPDGRQVLTGDSLRGMHFLELAGIEAVPLASPAHAASAARDTAIGVTAARVGPMSVPPVAVKRWLFGWWRRR